ncbi:hypothetical protein DDB_G0290949 [Dictyostelium discoideum AX4]|uniref:hypothetical protein n=1 Tax=Dictyostelium discoideum AX4 TaxID=352472 RepID=UPI00004E3ED6|nr:hypothetical protein DDB_G0290949 [Dictyostelium discoideum AX4]EAL61990.1 hypothetical protein DDB_G0290949 [Dictyostelium discoideum AX4]|eukprot:XP_635481.1 hypothetical protein DDB_G0290949 [Dictyostelium discoideum AX4]
MKKKKKKKKRKYIFFGVIYRSPIYMAIFDDLIRLERFQINNRKPLLLLLLSY